MEDVGQHIVCAFGQEVSSFVVVESSFGVRLSPQLVWYWPRLHELISPVFPLL